MNQWFLLPACRRPNGSESIIPGECSHVCKPFGPALRSPAICLRESVPWKGGTEAGSRMIPPRTRLLGAPLRLPFPLPGLPILKYESLLISKASKCRLAQGLGTPARALPVCEVWSKALCPEPQFPRVLKRE